VLAATRIHGDDTTVAVLAKGKTVTGRLWTSVRDDPLFGGDARPAALLHYSPDWTATHPLRQLPGGRVSCRPMPMPGSMVSMTARASLAR
jgi:transposase